MKRKNFFAVLCTLALAFTFMFSAINFAPLSKEAKAAASTETLSLGLSAGMIPSTVSYGDTINIPAGASNAFNITLLEPNKGEKTINDSVTSIKVDQLGYYTVRFASKTDDSVYYEHKIFSSLTDEVEIVVENEAEIPTIVKTGNEKKLPAAYLAVKDENGKLVKVAGSEANVKVKTDRVASVDLTANFKYENAGTTFVTYYANYLDGTKMLSKTYEVKVQNDFADTKAPTLSLSGVPTTANIKKAVTLPVATATDSFDNNVKVEVKVTYVNADGETVNVKEAEVDEKNEIATAELDTEVKFDNKDNMTFYPFAEGEYKVSYQAIDDSGNKSASWNYTITVSDKKAPVMTLDETKIPAKWGYNTVTRLGENDEKVELTGNDLMIHFDVPEVIDNASAKDKITISFSIKDARSSTILNFQNINQGVGADGTSTTCAYGTVNFNNVNGFDFDLKAYVNKKRTDDPNYLVAGNYVATYTAIDEAKNRSTKVFTIAVSESFDDNSNVTVKFDDVAEYLVLNANKATEFIVPVPTYASTTDNKLTLNYTLGNGTDTVAVNGGEEAEIKCEESKYFLYVAGVKAFEVTGVTELVLTANAVSDAGNKLATAATATIDLIVPSPTALFSDFTVDFTNGAGYEFPAAQEYELGSAKIALTANDVRNKVGVEIGVRNADGEYLSDVTAEIYAVEDSIIVRNIKVETNKDGNFFLEVIAYDISGNRSIKVIPFAIAERQDSSIVAPASTSVSASGVNETFKLNGAVGVTQDAYNDYVGAAQAKLVFVRKINGGHFALMGDEFTALSTGNYSIVNAYDAVDEVNLTTTVNTNKEYISSTESIVTVTDNAAINFELQGLLPTYAFKAADATEDPKVELPKAVAYSKNANAEEIEVEVKLNGEKVEIKNEAGKDYFVAGANGTYTVIYTVKVAGEASTFEYKVKSGDVQAPTFKLMKGDSEASHATSVKTGYEFEFLKVVAEDEIDAVSKLTFKKTVIGPDGETYGGTINAKGTSGADKTTPSSGKFTLDEAGKYTVIYEVIDEAGNSAVREFEITVTGKSSGSGISLAALSTILIIVGVLLIAGVVVYLFRFRKVKKNDK